MLLIMIGIIMSFLVLFLFSKIQKGKDVCGPVFLLDSLIIGISFFIGVASPISGYTDWEKEQEIPLISLSSSDETGDNIFVIKSDDQYSFKYEVDTTEYMTYNIFNKNVEEVEDSFCKVPMLYIYTRKGKMSIWTFAFGTTEKKYKFYVPEGTIQEKIEL